MRVGVALAIIDSAESIQLLGAEGVWDLADIETNVAFEKLFARQRSCQFTRAKNSASGPYLVIPVFSVADGRSHR